MKFEERMDSIETYEKLSESEKQRLKKTFGIIDDKLKKDHKGRSCLWRVSRRSGYFLM